MFPCNIDSYSFLLTILFLPNKKHNYIPSKNVTKNLCGIYTYLRSFNKQDIFITHYAYFFITHIFITHLIRLT